MPPNITNFKKKLTTSIVQEIYSGRITDRLVGLEAALTKLTQRDGLESVETAPVWEETSWSFARYGKSSLYILIASLT
jgi:hypothetical protein